ncbi:MAG: DUF1614 domain-containing protein [Aristaeellaceae bacterium]
MTVGAMLLTIAAVLVFCGLLQRVLDRMHLTDRQALLLIGAMLVGTWLPNLRIGAIAVNIGGALIPLGVCVYLFIKADSPLERWRTALGTVLTGAAVYGLSALLPGEAEALPFDPMWLYGVCGGIIAWVVGRSRRGAFVCGVAGVLLADIVNALVISMQGYQTQLVLGGGGIADAAVISGVIAVLMCELIGETIERFVRARTGGDD